MKSWMMRFSLKLLFALIILFAALLLVTYLFLLSQGKAILIKQLENLTHKKVNIGHFGVTPPLNIDIKNLNIDGLLRVNNLYASPSISALLFGRIALNNLKIERPELTYEKGMALGEGLPVASFKAEKSQKKRALPFLIKRVIIKDGKATFIDHTVGPEGIIMTVKDLDFNLSNLYAFPRSVITNFELKAKIPWRGDEKEGSIEAEGWLNLVKKDMQATLNIRDIDGIYLYPYYSNWVDLEKARIERATLNFSSNINGLNNNVVAECHLELTDIVRRPLQAEESAEKASKITDAVLEVFRALSQGKIVLDFTIRTKMDRPEFGFGNIKMAFEDKLAQAKKAEGFSAENILALPTKLMEGAFKGVTDLTTTVITGTINAGKQIKDAVEDTFKKEKKEEEKKE